eukprot:jgi/Antlo1/1904/2387
MTLEQATDLYRKLVKTVKKFKSPAFRTYFLRKSHDDYKSLQSEIDEGKYECAIKKYMKEQSELLDAMKRQTVIYNMFYDEENNI